MLETSYWVYILHCNNDTYYTGYTTDMVRRYKEHSQGSVKCKYTRSFKPLAIAQCWQAECKNIALMLERFIKKLSRQQKEQLIACPDKLLDLFPNSSVSVAPTVIGSSSTATDDP